MTVALALQNEHWYNTLTTVTDNSATVTCHCTTVPVDSTMVSGNPDKVAGYRTITGDPMTKRTASPQKSATQSLSNVTTVDASER